jgi:hypothetical protein
VTRVRERGVGIADRRDRADARPDLGRPDGGDDRLAVREQIRAQRAPRPRPPGRPSARGPFARPAAWRRYAAGTGVRLFAALSHVPAGLRERLVASAFGLNRMAVDADGASA